MTSFPDALIRASGIVGQIYGQDTTLSATAPVYVGVWPIEASGGPRSEMVIIRPVVDVHFGVVPNSDEIDYGGPHVDTMGPRSAFLAKDVEYVFPLGPRVNTIAFLPHENTVEAVRLRWIITRKSTLCVPAVFVGLWQITQACVSFRPPP